MMSLAPDGLTNDFVISVFVKVYRRVYWKVEVKLLFYCFQKNAQISGTKKFPKSKKKMFSLELGNV